MAFPSIGHGLRERSSHAVAKPASCPINKLPEELVDIIMRSFITNNPEEENESLSALHACSLTQRRWRRSAQRAFHSIVFVWPEDSEHKFRLYSPACQPYGANLHLYPRDLHVNSYDTKNAEDWEHLCNFAKRCGERITTLCVREVRFANFDDFLALLKYFPHLTELVLMDCTWENGSFSIRNNGDNPPSRRCAGLSAPSSLRLVCVDGCLRRGTLPLPLAHWLMHSRDGMTLDVSCVLKFSVIDISAIHTSEALQILGPSLTSLTLDVEVTEAWSNDFQQLRFPDLSYNSRLRSLRIYNVVPKFCPPNYLASVLSKVNSLILEKVAIQFVFDDMTLHDADLFDFERFDRLLSDRSRFTRLKQISFMAIQDHRDVDQQSFSSYVTSKLPLVKGHKDIDVQVSKVYWMVVPNEEEGEDVGMSF